MAPEVQDTIKEFKVKSNQLVARVREIIREGEAKRVIIKRDDHVYMEIPLSYGLGGAMAAIWLAPTLAAVGALAALVSEVELVIEHEAPVPTKLPAEPAPGVAPEESPVGDSFDDDLENAADSSDRPD